MKMEFREREAEPEGFRYSEQGLSRERDGAFENLAESAWKWESERKIGIHYFHCSGTKCFCLCSSSS